MYAMIATGGKQYKVAEGDIIKVEKLGVDAGETVNISFLPNLEACNFALQSDVVQQMGF